MAALSEIKNFPLPRWNTARAARRGALAASAGVILGTFGYLTYDSSNFTRNKKTQAQKIEDYKNAPPMELGFPLHAKNFQIDVAPPLPLSKEYRTDPLGTQAEFGLDDLPFVELKDHDKDQIGIPINGYSILPSDTTQSAGIRFDYFKDTDGKTKIVVNAYNELRRGSKIIPLDRGLMFAGVRYDATKATDQPESTILVIRDNLENESYFEFVDTKRAEGRFILLKLIRVDK